MSGSTELARRSGSAPAQAAPAAALTLRSGQTRFDEQQRAALATLGIKSDAPQADLDVFLHVSQRMGLDPFAKQIHLIYYRVNEAVYNPRTKQWDDNWIEKPSIQTGIAGFRVQRDRVGARLGVLIDYEDTLWFDENGKSGDVWLWDNNPTACRVVTKISDGRRFGATIRFNEFAKRNKSGGLTGRWRDGHSYQIEKCAEAASLRKAFPQDFAGLDLDVEIESDPDAPAPEPPAPARERVTAAQARASAPPRVTATVETVTTDPSPAAPESPRSAPTATPNAEATAAGEANNGPAPDDPEYRRAMNAAQAQLKRFTAGETEAELSESKRILAARILRVESITSMSDLTVAELRTISNTCGSATGSDSAAQLEALLTKGVTPGAE